MKKNSRKIPEFIKNDVKLRQKGLCACCLNAGRHYHHVRAWSITNNHIGSKNIILLCEEHHKLFHLGNPDTFQAIYEYAWYLIHNKLPEEKDLSEIANEVAKALDEMNEIN
jgi:hypothetical protein